MTQTGVKISVDIEASQIKGTCSIVSFIVMTHKDKILGYQKVNVSTKLHLATENTLITSDETCVKIGFFLNFLMIGWS